MKHFKGRKRLYQNYLRHSHCAHPFPLCVPLENCTNLMKEMEALIDEAKRIIGFLASGEIWKTDLADLFKHQCTGVRIIHDVF